MEELKRLYISGEHITWLDIPDSIYNALVLERIISIDQLLKMSDVEISHIKGVGKKGSHLIREALKSGGYQLGCSYRRRYIPDEYIRCLRLTPRPHYALIRNGIKTVGQLLEMSEDDLLRLKNMGPYCIDIIRQALNEHGLMLKVYDEENINHSQSYEFQYQYKDEIITFNISVNPVSYKVTLKTFPQKAIRIAPEIMMQDAFKEEIEKACEKLFKFKKGNNEPPMCQM